VAVVNAIMCRQNGFWALFEKKEKCRKLRFFILVSLYAVIPMDDKTGGGGD